MKIIVNMFLRIYSAIWCLIIPILRLFVRLRNYGWEERCGKIVPQGYFDLWIHSSSGGEAYLVKQIVKELPTNKNLRILATTWTKQGFDVLTDIAKNQDNHEICIFYFPFDNLSILNKFFASAKFDVLLLLETELWPALLFLCRQKNICVILANARITCKSFNMYKYLSFFLKFVAPKFIFATAEDDAARYKILFPNSKIKKINNIKFEQFNLLIERDIEFSKIFNKFTKIIVLASIRKEEENLIGSQLINLLNENICLIIVPRHMHRVKVWEKILAEQNIQFVLRSKILEIQKTINSSVILWDKFGELNKLYQIATHVFVGGSLAPCGGQNFLEPIMAGVRPVVGPYLDNFLWIGKEFFDNKLVLPIKNSFQLPQAMEIKLLPKSEVINKMSLLLENMENGSQVVVKVLLPYFEK